MNSFRQLALITTLCCLGTLVVSGDANGEVRRKAGLSMQSAGMGDATRSTSVGHNALIQNPAGMSQVKAYQVTTGFGYNLSLIHI